MFGLPLYSELLNGSAQRTWNCVARVVDVLWHKVAQRLGILNTMPRSRRRHHSRSRSRSNSHDRDREPKRRKVESFDSPHNRRSVSSEPEANESVVESVGNVTAERVASADDSEAPAHSDCETSLMDTSLDVSVSDPNTSASARVAPNALNRSLTTPQKPLTPKQLQKKLESEKKRAERAKEKEAVLKKRQAERDERLRAKQAKEAKLREERDAKLKEREEKDKEREMKRKEKEEKDKEREEVRLKRQAEIDKKKREKQKIEESKQKAAAAFTKFFVAKAGGAQRDEAISENAYFMPFPLKSDMRLAPSARNSLTDEQKDDLLDSFERQASHSDYLVLLKANGSRRSSRTWPCEDIVNDDAQIVSNTAPTTTVMKAKFLKFHENRRPAYFGTWRKKSPKISGRNYLGQDPSMNYEAESDDEWEEEEEGEDIVGSDDEDKQEEHDEENNDYEVDDEFFVPHGHLSEDEEDDDENISPEMRKAKEKLLKNQFDEERKAKTQRLKSRVIGCVWYGRRDDNQDGAVDQTLDLILRPYRAISNGVVKIRKREDFEVVGKGKWSLEKEHWPDLIRLLHGNTNKKRALTNEFAEFVTKKDLVGGVKKAALSKLIQSVAKWGKCKVEGGMYNKMCWMVNEDVRREFPSVKLSLPNCWKYCTALNAKEN